MAHPNFKGKGKTKQDVVELPLQDEGLLEAMKCHNCRVFDYPIEGAVWMCARGHLTCSLCQAGQQWDCCEHYDIPNPRINRHNLPICGFPLDIQKCKLYTAIFNACTFYCDYSDAGCKEVMLGSDYALHVAMCPFRPAPVGPPIIVSEALSFTLVVKSVDAEAIEAKKKMKLPSERSSSPLAF